MMSRALGAVNPLLVEHPERALEICGGLLAVGGALTLRKITRAVGISEKDLSPAEATELVLLDANAPKGFWARSVEGVTSSLLGGYTATVRWNRGIWNVGRPVLHVGPGEPVFDAATTRIITPLLDESTGELAPSNQVISDVLAVNAGVAPRH